MELHELLKYRFQAAKAFTKPFHEDIKRSIEDYELNESEEEKLEQLINVNRRYEFKIPYIFATQESMLSSMFDKVPDLIIKGRGARDREKARKIDASYEYLNDLLDLETFATQEAWWFILTGFCSAHASFKSEYEEIPTIGELGEPTLNELGEPITTISYTYNDPVIYVGDPLKEYWSPESEFSHKADKVPYYFRKALMNVDEIKEMFGKEVEPDSRLEVKGIEDQKESDDIKRAEVFFYKGNIPEANKGDVKEWKLNKIYYCAFTQKELLMKPEEQKDILCRLGKWHGRPNGFFGFGIGKTLREFQKELSIRRGQQMRYADLAAFPKLLHDLNTEIDEKAALDPRALPTITFNAQNSSAKPEYLSPPDMSGTLILSEEKARQDAQFVSGLLDLSKGTQDSTTVKTATGQSIFADAAEKRIRQAKRQFFKFYREVVIMLLKLCQENWDEQKALSVTDEDGNDLELIVSKEDFKDINFDTDIDIDVESTSINKEVLRAQAIEFYNAVKDDPVVDRTEVIKDTMRDAFNKNDPQRFIAEQGMVQPMADPTGQINPTSSMGGVVGQNVGI